MRVTEGEWDGVTRVVLSKRNLLSLLSKLEMEGSARTIYRDGVEVSVEEDDEHYGERTPGPMHPFTEDWIVAHEKAANVPPPPPNDRVNSLTRRVSKA